MIHLNTEETILEQHRYLSLLHLKKHFETGGFCLTGLLAGLVQTQPWPPHGNCKFTARLGHLRVASAHLCCLLQVTWPHRALASDITFTACESVFSSQCCEESQPNPQLCAWCVSQQCGHRPEHTGSPICRPLWFRGAAEGIPSGLSVCSLRS